MTIRVNEPYQTGYEYALTKAIGQDFDPDFKPQLTPKEMLQLGIFGGNYFTRPPKEFPADWFAGVRFTSTGHADASLNYFKVNASQSLREWQKKGWIYFEDPQGWFLWYCRYYLGRRIPQEDQRQIKRWRAIKRHVSQIQNVCQAGDILCRPRQRQAVLHWAYDSRKI